MNRPTIYQVLAENARAWALRSTCSRRHVGAVIATHQGVTVSSGYNGAPAGMEHCNHECDCVDLAPGSHEGGCRATISCTTAIHAEENAILFAARRGVSTYGTMIVSTYGPCYRCARMIVQAGINMVLYLEPNPDLKALELFQASGVSYLQSTTLKESL